MMETRGPSSVLRLRHCKNVLEIVSKTRLFCFRMKDDKALLLLRCSLYCAVLAGSSFVDSRYSIILATDSSTVNLSLLIWTSAFSGSS